VGANVAADPVSGNNFQVVKLDGGGAGVSIPIVAGQRAMAASIPVVLASDQPALPSTDSGTAWTTTWGVSGVPVTSADMSGGAVAVTDAPTSGKKIILDDLIISSDTALRFILTCQTTNAVIMHVRCPANSTVQVTLRGQRMLATADKYLACQASGAGNVEILAGYHSST
jgi:hypothetical protein